MGFFLFLIALILSVVFSLIGMVFMVIMTCVTWYESYLNNYWRNLAISLDQFGNVAMSGLFNVILIKGNSHLFGDPDETISSVLGKNQEVGALAFLGRRLTALLDTIEKNHSLKSIEK